MEPMTKVSNTLFLSLSLCLFLFLCLSVSFLSVSLFPLPGFLFSSLNLNMAIRMNAAASLPAIAGLLALIAAFCMTDVNAYAVPIDPACVNATAPPKLVSYHIHVLFIATNDDYVAQAMQLQRDFVNHFNVPIGNDKNCSFAAGDPRPEQKTICAYPTTWVPDGPFPTAQYSFFIPASFYAETVQWITQRRNGLDVLVHPNSGCEIQDHLEWPLWGGKPWELNVDAFHCDSPGCIPPS
eukprot:m.17482 g.17482  ORF g.17482 m.17482 type:complete len:238 (+) comp8293_c0_seq1:1852-2565(+)